LKIDPTTGSATPLRLVARGRTASARPANEPANSLKEQADEIPSNVRHIQEPEAPFDAAKVQAIREEIRAGRYTIDPRRIADGLLKSVRDLIPGQQNESST